MAFQYENAPIKEALIDIRVDLPASATLRTLEDLHRSVGESYPGKKRSIYLEGQFSAGEGDQFGTSTKQKQIGYQFSSADGRQIFHPRLDGFTYSRLRPYGNWVELRDEARRLWDIYRSAVRPLKITRVAVRYVNQIDIPLAVLDYKDYFRTSPEVSPDLPQAISGFFMQIQFPQSDFGGVLILTQAAVPPPSSDTNSVILDLDVFKEGIAASDDEAWSLLETLRIRKNEFFEGCITDKARALFGSRREY